MTTKVEGGSPNKPELASGWRNPTPEELDSARAKFDAALKAAGVDKPKPTEPKPFSPGPPPPPPSNPER